MAKGLFIFFVGVLIALLTVGGVLVGRTFFFASADPDLTPREVKITRTSPTAGLVSFKTDKASVASIECATTKEGPFSLCGAETVSTSEHEIKTSIILDPEKEYFFVIKIGNETFDNLGIPLVLTTEDKQEGSADFPTDFLGLCETDSLYQEEFDINKDGCIRQNDKILYETQ
jgi:hypothetical protein